MGRHDTNGRATFSFPAAGTYDLAFITFDGGGCEALRAAHATLLDAGLRCTLDRRARLVVPGGAIDAARAAIGAAFDAAGLSSGD